MLFTAAALIALGGLYDVFVPQLPANLAALCGSDAQACRLARELLRALGGALMAIGLAVAFLVVCDTSQPHRLNLILVLLLVVPSEGINSFCMYRVGSPYYIPLAFVLLTVVGVLLAWAGPLT
jgi:uncharacterized protein YjeT (DUF2065 family)